MTVYEKIIEEGERYVVLHGAIPQEYWALVSKSAKRKHHALDIAAVVNSYFYRAFHGDLDWDDIEVQYGPETTTVKYDDHDATFPTEWLGMGPVEWRGIYARQMQQKHEAEQAARAAKAAATKEKRDRAAWARLVKKFGTGGIDNPPTAE